LQAGGHRFDPVHLHHSDIRLQKSDIRTDGGEGEDRLDLPVWHLELGMKKLFASALSLRGFVD
jgi:hypothetical protein